MTEESTARVSLLVALLRQSTAIPPAGRSLIMAALGFGLYGAVAGFFTGGEAIALAAAKIPLIAAVSLVLCLPSLVVFVVVAGEDRDPRALAEIACGVAAVVGVFLLALAPVAWLFSVSSRSVGFIAVFHLLMWCIALRFGIRFLRQRLTSVGARRTALVWALLLFVVSLQVAAYLGPVLGRRPGQPAFELEREFFMTRFVRVVDAGRAEPERVTR